MCKVSAMFVCRSAVSSSDDSEVELFSAVRNSVRKGKRKRRARGGGGGKTTMKVG